MFRPVRLNGGRTEGYGLGWALSTYRGRHIKHHAGGIEGFSCLYLRIPEEDASVVMLTNLELFQCAAPARRLIDRMLTLPQADPTPVDLPQSVLNGRTGTYANTTAEFTVTAKPGCLLVTMGDGAHRMRPISETTYVAETDGDLVLRFHDDDPDGRPRWSSPCGRAPATGYRRQHMLTTTRPSGMLRHGDNHPTGGQRRQQRPDAGLRAVAALRALTEELEILQVGNARLQGWSWQEIAKRLGVTKQTVHRKHGRRFGGR